MKILLGYKGVNVGKDLCGLAVKHAKAFNGEVLIITSMVGGDHTKAEEIAVAKENLKNVKKIFEDHGVKNETHLLIRGFSPSEDILDFASRNDIDEIIIGVKSRSKVGKIIFGSTAQSVILESKCPVVSVK